jgi:heterodisulfide reductase subunit A-like polyferredoxin/coenzyme F420-reducing hydrogenase delta subunit
MAAKVGLIICHPELTAADSLSWTSLSQGLAGPVLRAPLPDSLEPAQELAGLIKDKELTGFVLAASPQLDQTAQLNRALEEAGLDPEMGLILDLGPTDDLSKHLAEPQVQLTLSQALAGQVRRRPAADEPFLVSSRVLVLGQGPAALLAASDLAKSGYLVTLLAPSDGLEGADPLLGPDVAAWTAKLLTKVEAEDKIEVLTGNRLVSLSGAAGRFRARLRGGSGEESVLDLGAVIVAQGPPRSPDLASLGLAPAKRILPLAEAVGLAREGKLAELAADPSALRVALTNGLGHESDPLHLRAAAGLALQVQKEMGGQAVLLTDNTKVAAPDLEQLTQEAKAAGVVLVKLSGSEVRLEAKENAVRVGYLDQVLDQEVDLEFDLLVVDDVPAPDPDYVALAESLGLKVEPDGTLQPDLVNALPLATPRRGVLVIGPAKAKADLTDLTDQALAAVMEVRKLLGSGELHLKAPVEIIDTGKCAVCLTCVRVCPEGAMIVDLDKPASNPLACTGCGTCASECPQDAIIMLNQGDDIYRAQIMAGVGAQPNGSAPEMLVFACANSAATALARARGQGWNPPAGVRFIQVPCASKIDPIFVLQAFSQGYQGVMILSCFQDACQSLTGNRWLSLRAEHLKNLLTEAGLDPARLVLAGIGPNMKAEPAELIDKMAADLAGMEPADLRPSGREAQERFKLELGPELTATP